MNAAFLLATVDTARGQWWPDHPFGRFCVLFGLAAQAVFSARFLVQWIASERKGESHMPVAFWYLSLVGGLMLFAYAVVWKHDLVVALGQTTGIVVYVRNLVLIHKKTHPHLDVVTRDLALIAVIVAAVCLPSMFTRDLWNPDEPRYTEVAREMVVLGDYLVPHLNGEVYAEKGPLFFWLTAGFWHLGAGYNSGRMVAMFAVLGTMMLIYLGTRGMLGRKGALLAVGVTLSTAILFKFARRGVLDPLLMLTITLSIIAGFRAMLPETRRRYLYWLACYAGIALGAINKGPVALAVTAVVLVPFGIVARKQVKGGGWLHLAGIAALFAIVLPWLIPACARGGEDYTHRLLLGNLGRAYESDSHRARFYYYLYFAPALLMPWTLLLPSGLIAGVGRWRSDRDKTALLAGVWLLAPLILFSVISGKRGNYILPVAPAVGILVAWYLTTAGVREGRLLSAEKWLTSLAFAGLLAMAGVLALGIAMLGFGSPGKPLCARGTEYLPVLVSYVTPSIACLGVVLLVAPAWSCIMGLRTDWRAGGRRAAFLAGAVLAFSLPVDLLLTPVINRLKSGRGFAQVVTDHFAQEDQTIYLFGDEFSGVYNLYTGRVHMPVIEREDVDRLRSLLATPGELIITRHKRLRGALSPEETARHMAYEERVGHRVMVLLRGREPDAPGSGEPAP